MAATTMLDRQYPQERDGRPTIRLTSVNSGAPKTGVTIGSLARLAGEVPSSGATATRASNLTGHDFAVIATQPLSQNNLITKGAQSIFGSSFKPTEGAAEHGWTEFSHGIALDFANMVKAEYGENIMSPVTVALHAPVPPSRDQSTLPNRTISLSQIPSSPGALGNLETGKKPSTRESSASQRKTEKPLKHETKIFASFQARLEWILPKNTVARLLEDSHRCVNENVKPGRCARKLKIPYQSTIGDENMHRTVDFDFSEETSIKLTLDLMSKSLCSWHLNERTPGLSEIRRSLSTMPDDKKVILRGWMKALLQISGAKERESVDSKQASAATRLRTAENPKIVTAASTSPSYEKPFTRSMANQQCQINTTLYVLPQNISKTGYIQQWKAYKPNAARTPKILIENLLTRCLLPSEKTAGYIYMYWFPPNFGYLKIGRTGKLPGKRFEEWEKQCKHSVEDANRHSRFVKHVALVEKLVHAELRDQRVQEIGCVCRKTHQEWFVITPEYALKVLDKFAKYMDQTPYEVVGAHPNEQFRPNKDILNANLGQLCKLVDITPPENSIGPKPDPRRRSKGRRRSS